MSSITTVQTAPRRRMLTYSDQRAEVPETLRLRLQPSQNVQPRTVTLTQDQFDELVRRAQPPPETWGRTAVRVGGRASEVVLQAVVMGAVSGAVGGAVGTAVGHVLRGSAPQPPAPRAPAPPSVLAGSMVAHNPRSMHMYHIPQLHPPQPWMEPIPVPPPPANPLLERAQTAANTATGGVVGTVVGAALGTVVPGIGNVLGGTVGGILGGFIGSLF